MRPHRNGTARVGGHRAAAEQNGRDDCDYSATAAARMRYLRAFDKQELIEFYERTRRALARLSSAPSPVRDRVLRGYEATLLDVDVEAEMEWRAERESI